MPALSSGEPRGRAELISHDKLGGAGDETKCDRALRRILSGQVELTLFESFAMRRGSSITTSADAR